MENSLKSFIDILEPYVPGAIINDRYWSCIKEISRGLPLVSFGFFEFWFSASQPRIDFDISINGWINEHKLASKAFSQDETFTGFKNYRGTRNMVQFLNKWIQPDFRLKHLIKQIWLVYDILDPLEMDYIPWYYIKFTYIPLFQSLSLAKTIVPETLSLLNEPYSVEFKKGLQCFFDSVPPSVFVSAIGIQTNRRVGSLRVYLTVQAYEDIFSLLQRYEWPGNINDLRIKLDYLNEGCNFYGLCVDLGPELQSTIGVEFWFSEETVHKGLRTLTNKLIDLGLCTRPKQKDFLDWNGEFILKNEPGIWSWPDQDHYTKPFIPKEVVIRRNPRYVKIVYNTGQPMIAKGYLGFERPVFKQAEGNIKNSEPE